MWIITPLVIDTYGGTVGLAFACSVQASKGRSSDKALSSGRFVLDLSINNLLYRGHGSSTAIIE